jgi:hypothetical protein
LSRASLRTLLTHHTIMLCSTALCQQRLRSLPCTSSRRAALGLLPAVLRESLGAPLLHQALSSFRFALTNTLSTIARHSS